MRRTPNVETISKWKMRINWQRTKVIVVERGSGTCHLVVDGVEIEKVQTTKYLRPCSVKEQHVTLRLRIELGQRQEWWGALRRQVIKRKEQATKLREINTMVVPTLLYGRLGLFRRDTEAEFRQWR